MMRTFLPAMVSEKHYVNSPMQYTAMFKAAKNEGKMMKTCDICPIVAQNMYM